MADRIISDEFLTPEFRVDFPKIFNPEVLETINTETGEPDVKYSLGMIFPKTDILRPMYKIIEEVKTKAFGIGTIAGLHMPLKVITSENKDLNKYPQYKDCVLGKASSRNFEIQVVYRGKEYVTNPKELYGGCYAIAKVAAFSYDFIAPNGVRTRGVKLGLRSINMTRRGEPFFSRSSNAMSDYVAVDMSQYPEDAGYKSQIQEDELPF